jgi:hypothetical protein
MPSPSLQRAHLRDCEDRDAKIVEFALRCGHEAAEYHNAANVRRFTRTPRFRRIYLLGAAPFTGAVEWLLEMRRGLFDWFS